MELFPSFAAAIRARELVYCPQCGARTVWRNELEYLTHHRACIRIELGLIATDRPRLWSRTLKDTSDLPIPEG